MSVLIPSKRDDVQLAIAVAQRFSDLRGTHLRVTGIDLIPPKSLMGDFTLFRNLVKRIQSGDNRHSDDEKKALRVVAQWTLDVNCRLRNQPMRQLEWID